MMQATKTTDALLEACVAAFAAFAERNTPTSREALAEARRRFHQAVAAEFGAIADLEVGGIYGKEGHHHR